VVTADADGQHDPDDIVRVCQRFVESPGALVLGARGFAGDVPLRSRFGNSLTRRVMRAVLGQKLSDTQTGLRAIPRSMLPRLMKIPATGYEFELEMLIVAKHQSVPVIEQPVRTIYEPGNPASHFQPLRDSMRIYFVLLRFSMISLVTAVIDNLTFYLVFHATGAIAGAQIAGRTAAVLFNYRSVRRAVFFSDQPHRVVLPRYLALVAANALVSYAGIRLLSTFTPLGVFPSKILTESMLFIANFTIQRDFIFTRRPPYDQPSGF
jgi:putative flippase GtrA